MKLEQHLEDFFDDIDFSELGQAFERFCPFETMGMVRAEIRHSTFLRNMLDPSYEHGFGSEILQAFLGEVARAWSCWIESIWDSQIRRDLIQTGGRRMEAGRNGEAIFDGFA